MDDKWRGGGRRRIREIIHEPSAISHLVNDRGGGRDEITERLINSGKLAMIWRPIWKVELYAHYMEEGTNN